VRKGEQQAANLNRRERWSGQDCLHPAWIAFIRHCQALDFGEIALLKIQDGLPVMAEEIVKKVKFV